jgi:hypothetical protein
MANRGALPKMRERKGLADSRWALVLLRLRP